MSLEKDSMSRLQAAKKSYVLIARKEFIKRRAKRRQKITDSVAINAKAW